VARAVAGLPVVRAAMAVLVALPGQAPRGGLLAAMVTAVPGPVPLSLPLQASAAGVVPVGQAVRLAAVAVVATAAAVAAVTPVLLAVAGVVPAVRPAVTATRPAPTVARVGLAAETAR